MSIWIFLDSLQHSWAPKETTGDIFLTIAKVIFERIKTFYRCVPYLDSALDWGVVDHII